MNQFAQLLFGLGMVTGFAYVVAVNKEITAQNLGDNEQIEVTAMGSLALICDTGSNGDNIAKVYCGEKGLKKAVAVTNPKYEDVPEFEITDMACTGSESSLTACAWNHEKIISYPHCGTYVGAECNA